MDQKILFTLILSSGLATTTYGLTSKANIHIFMQHMLKNSGDVATPDKKKVLITLILEAAGKVFVNIKGCLQFLALIRHIIAN